jgi:hypothetical protein
MGVFWAPHPRVDWLTKGEYEAHLVELPARGGGL